MRVTYGRKKSRGKGEEKSPLPEISAAEEKKQQGTRRVKKGDKANG